MALNISKVINIKMRDEFLNIKGVSYDVYTGAYIKKLAGICMSYVTKNISKLTVYFFIKAQVQKFY